MNNNIRINNNIINLNSSITHQAIHGKIDTNLDSYKALVRALKRTDGFSLLFVRCSPVQGDRIIADIRADIPNKTMEVLALTESIDNLYDILAVLPNQDQINVLFVKGIEYSIFAYEDREMDDVILGSRSSVYGGTWQGIPRILGHLNLSRERFRDNFKFCFVFLLPEFALNYFIRRAPDFFDWRSNIYEFSTEFSTDSLFDLNGSYEEYCKQTHTERVTKLSAILSYFNENIASKKKADLWFEKGLIHRASKEYMEAIDSFEQALKLNQELYAAWKNQGCILDELGRYEEAITFYEKALQINPHDNQTWYVRGFTLSNLGKYKEAIASYDKALQFKPDYHQAWYNKACAYSLQNKIELALENLQKSIQINPEENRKMAKIDSDFDNIRHDPRFQALIQ
jgi:tetratricopeptide (TPR) repeat protein